MLILTFFLFFARSFPFISLFSRGENTKSPLQGGSRALPQGFGPETRNFGRFVTEGFWTPQNPTVRIHGGYNEWGWEAKQQKLMEFIGILLHYLVSSGGSNLMPNVAGDFEGFFLQIISA